MQRLALEQRQKRSGSGSQLRLDAANLPISSTIHRITEYRVTEILQVHADLMGASGL
jgi:hypothetical protein